MAKKNIKMMGRKALSLLLSLTMVTGMLQIPALASYDNQVMDGYYVVNENGVQEKIEGVSSVTEDGFTLTKAIRQTGKDAFDITLSVETSQTVTTSEAAVQLVIDTSSSMDECSENCSSYNCKHDSRLEAIQKILASNNGFLDSLASANTGAVHVSVVSFGENAKTVSDWTNIKTASGLSAVKSAVNGLKASDNATNMHAGLMLGRNRLAMDTVANMGAKFTVLLSDGFANCVGAESKSTQSISLSGSRPMSASATTAGTSNAKSMASTLKGMSTVYAVGYGVDKDYLVGIIGSEDNVFAGANSSSVSQAFANIAMSAVNGMNGAGTSVTDPMGQYIVLGDVSALASENVSANGNGIVWDLDPAKAEVTRNGDTTTYTYSITYPITLDTAAEGFDENVYYPANGHTYLSVPQTNAPAKKIAFLVPGVCGKIPQVRWSVEYYLQSEDSINADAPSYDLDDTDTKPAVKVWSSVDAPEGFEDKYSDEGYYFASGDTRLVISMDEESNVIRLYYNLVTAPVTVKHYYKTTTITPEGETIPGEYIVDPDKTSTEFAVVGDKYEAGQQPVFGGVEYDFDSAEPKSSSLTVKKDGENLIELFYSRIDDQRVRTSAQVDHVYTLYTYELNEDGVYALYENAPVKEEKVQYSEELPATSVYAVSGEALADYEGYVLNPELGDYEDLYQQDGSLSFVLKDEPQDNIRTLYYEKIEDNRQQTVVTVEHYYTKHITAIEDGEVVNYNEPDGKLGLSETFEVYAGEYFEAQEVSAYQGEDYEADVTNADKLVIDQVQGGEVIKLYYELSVSPEQAQVVANHYWRTFTEVTVELTEEVINEETGEAEIVVIGTTTETRESIDHKIEGIVYDGLYVGQKHVEAQKSWGEGYTYNAEESISEIYAGEDVEAFLFYDKYAEDDERSDADITVLHNYTTYWTTIVDGEVKTLTVSAGPVEESYEALAGDEFTAVAQPTYEGNEYTQITDESELSVILQPGTNAAIVINYERFVNDLVDTAYTVDYEYRTYNMTVNEDGVAGYWNAPEIAADSASGEGYVGQKIVLDPKAVEGFAPSQSNPAAVQILKGEDNQWSFIYERYIPLASDAVVVNHHYKTVTIAVNGTSSEAVQSVSGAPVVKYVGESYTAQAVLNGFEQTGVSIDGISAELAESLSVIVGEAAVIDFYYEKTVDLSVPVTYSVAHEYYLYDWDGTLTSVSKPAPVVGTGFATNQLVVAPESSDYALTSATYNGAEMDSYTVILQEGENTVVFVYEKTLARDYVDATVIHNYYKDEAAMQAEDAQVEKRYIEVGKNLPERSEFSAQIRTESGYMFHSAAPESMEIILTDSGENVIVLNYIRAAASYEVTHIYNVNGVEEGRTSETFGGLDGDIIAADSIARVEEYEGRIYSFVSISADIELDSEAQELPGIVVIYNRVEIVYEPDSDDDYEPAPKPEPKPEPEPEPIPQPELEEEVLDLYDEDVPLAEEPVVELPDEEVPLAEVPKTGIESAPFVVMSLTSGMGLAYMAITGKKREDEE